MIILSDTFGRKFHFNRIEEYYDERKTAEVHAVFPNTNLMLIRHQEQSESITPE